MFKTCPSHDLDDMVQVQYFTHGFKAHTCMLFDTLTRGSMRNKL